MLVHNHSAFVVALIAFALFTLSTSFGWDIGRALTTAVLVVLTGPAVLTALRRAARRAAFAAPVEFAPVAQAWPAPAEM